MPTLTHFPLYSDVGGGSIGDGVGSAVGGEVGSALGGGVGVGGGEVGRGRAGGIFAEESFDRSVCSQDIKRM